MDVRGKAVLLPIRENFYSSSKIRIAGTNLPPIKRVPAIPYVGVKRPGRETDHYSISYLVYVREKLPLQSSHAT